MRGSRTGSVNDLISKLGSKRKGSRECGVGNGSLSRCSPLPTPDFPIPLFLLATQSLRAARLDDAVLGLNLAALGAERLGRRSLDIDVEMREQARLLHNSA